MIETKPCGCGRKMILIDKPFALTTYPPQYPREWWCGGCGATAPAPNYVPPTMHEINQGKWEEANR